MFDLFRNREKTKKYFMGGILLMVSASMLLYLVPNYNTGTGANDLIVAKIGNDEITDQEARREIQQQTKGRQIPAEVIPNYVPQMIDQMITDRAMEYEAQKLGFQVSDQQLADAIRESFPNLFPEGKFVGSDAYAAMLAQQGTTIPEFEATLKRQMLVMMLSKVAMEGSVVTPAEIEEAYHKKNDQIQLDYVKLTADKFKKESEPAPGEVEQNFKTNAARYKTPEKRNLVVLIADQTQIEQSLNPTDVQLLLAYNQNQANFRLPERVHVRHILLMTQGKPAADEPKIKAKAEDLLKQLRAGADFAEVAKKNSEDPGSGSKGGDLDWVTRGQMVPEFEKAAFTQKPGVIGDLVKTQYGYHIVQVLAHEDARLKPFAEVKDDLAKQWKQQEASNRMEQISDKAQAALQKDPSHPETVAAALGMQVVHFDGFAPGQTIPAVGASPDFDQSVASLKKGEVSQPVSPAANKLVLAEVTDIIPERQSTFEEVKAQIHDQMLSVRQAKAVQDNARKLADAAKANGGDLAKAAKSLGLEMKSTTPFKQDATVDDLGPASYFADAFKDPVGTVLNPITMPEATVVVKIAQRVTADMSKLPEQRVQIRESLKGEKARERNTMFETGLMDELTRQGVVKLHPDVVRRIIESFRGNS
jgi:peptidyl-prolyl cis-trans isomerase D